jgi:hypothetical protein
LSQVIRYKRLVRCAEIMTQFDGYVLWNFVVEGQQVGAIDRTALLRGVNRPRLNSEREKCAPPLFLFIAALFARHWRWLKYKLQESLYSGRQMIPDSALRKTFAP